MWRVAQASLGLAAVIALALPGSVGAQDLAWAQGTDLLGASVTANEAGIYVGGFVDPLHEGTEAALLAFDDTGALLWSREFGSDPGFIELDDRIEGVVATGDAVYVVGVAAGEFAGNDSAGGIDAFVRKYDLVGAEVWTRQFGTAADDYAFAVAASGDGVYVTGATNGVFPGQSVAGGGADWFLRAYDGDGNELWTRQSGRVGTDAAYAATSTPNGVAIAGAGATTFPVGSSNALVEHYDAAGNFLWRRFFGALDVDAALGVAADDSAVYVSGYTHGALPGQTHFGHADAFVRKYDLLGAEVWTSQFGTSTTDQARSIAVDSTGVYVGGYTGGLLGESSSGASDAYVRKLDADGTLGWTQQFFASGAAEGVALDDAGIYVVAGALYKFRKFALPTIAGLADQVRAGGLGTGIERSLLVKLAHADVALSRGRVVAACALLTAFSHEAEALSGVQMEEGAGATLVADATAIAASLGCD